MANKTQYRKLESEPTQNDEPDESGRVPVRAERQLGGWFRLLCEIILVVAVVALSLKVMTTGSEAPRGRNDPIISFGYMDRTFMNDTKYANEEALADPQRLQETLANWLPLSSKGRGYVKIPREERATLDSPPYVLNPLHRPRKAETYMVSGFHQLHCLSTIMTSYARLRQGQDESERGYHIAHCFDYLRQGIICAGDATLEGNNSMKYPGVEIPWGTAHRCANWDALRDWADERTIWAFPPGIDIL